jgi:hypothetical protein
MADWKKEHTNWEEEKSIDEHRPDAIIDEDLAPSRLTSNLHGCRQASQELLPTLHNAEEALQTI